MIVVDVNVIAYLLVEGEHTRSSEAVYSADPDWAAPLLWRSEWRNVLAGYIRRGELDPPDAIERIRAASSLVAGREYPVEDELVLRLVEQSSLSAYDCEYVALAQALDVRLFTNDARISQAFPSLAFSPRTLVE